MLPVWWDNGAVEFGILNRKSNPPSWTWPTIAEALVKGANDATSPLTPSRTLEPDSKLPVMLTERAGRVTYTLSGHSHVSLRLYSLQGTIVTTFVQSIQSTGIYSIALPEHILATGSYLLELKVGTTRISRRIALFRKIRR